MTEFKETEEIERALEEKETSKKLKVISGKKLASLEIPEAEFLVEKILPKGCITIFAGKPCSFKSWILLEIAKSVSLNNTLFGKFETIKGNVLYIDEESAIPELKRRWLMIDQKQESSVDFTSMAGFKIDNSQDREELLELAEKENYQLVILDSFRNVHSLNENDSKEMIMLIDYLKELARKGITILLSHHQRKEMYLNPTDASQVLRGSTAILGGIDSLVSVENTKTGESRAELTVTQSKLRQGKLSPPFKITVVEDNNLMNFNFENWIETEEGQLERAKQEVLTLLRNKGELCRKEIINILFPLGIATRTVDRALKELREKEELVVSKGKGNRTLYNSK